MSAALLKKSLSIIDSDVQELQGKKRKVKKARNIDLVPQNQKIIKKLKKGRKVEKVNVLKTTSKLTVTEARRKFNSEKQRLKENLKKLKQIREASGIQLNHHLTKQILERARTRRPVKAYKNKTNKKTTVFTEEDFKKFEAEYIDE